ncbi:MAG: hypothetical protein IAE78_01940 [Myxococcus sp.]|nr:hypothetical protein [Myxococcus sp.]
MRSTLLAVLLAAAPDAGVALKPPAADAGAAPSALPPAPVATAAPGELERLRKRVGELEARTAELERQTKQLDALAKKLDATTDDLAAFKKQVDEREETRQAAERRVVEQKQRFESVTRSLVTVDQQLSTGATNVNEALRAAEATYTGAALQYVQAARASLANGDVNTARKYLLLAVLEAQAARP